MQRPSFAVVTSVVTLLAVMAFFSKLAVGLIPLGPENRLASASAEFLQQASHHQIDWRLLNEATFAEARKKDKPIMLVVGSACSPTGRGADKFVFRAKEVRGFLARNFICVRVDSMAWPEYMNAFLPISRAIMQTQGRLAIPPDYQVWFLDPKGHLFGYAAENKVAQPLDVRAFMVYLAEAVDRFDRLRENNGTAGEEQRQDLAIIEQPVEQELPDLTRFASYLSGAEDPTGGGFPINGFQRLWPSVWKFQLYAGRYQEFGRSIGPCLMSPQVDVLDGGFFTDAATLDWHGIGFDKLAVTNAGMLHTLAMGATLMNDPQQKWLAERTFDSLAGEFAHDGFVRAGRVGDEAITGRSARSSFSPRMLRAIFPEGSDREWARENLGLKVETNPQMVPMLARLDLPMAEAERFKAITDTLRKSRPEATFAGLALLDVGGFVTARMLQSARILGDTERLRKAEMLFERMDEFRSLNDVTHSRAAGVEPHAYLGDYLAYADVALHYFLATGNEIALRNGLAVLRRGLFLYGGKAKGVYNLSQPTTQSLAPQDAAVPEIVDNIRESCTAQIIRLCNDYGRLLGKSGADLSRAASDALTRFAPISGGLGPFGGGYFSAAVDMQDPTYALVVGPNAVEKAKSLSRLAPSRLVAPAIGPIKPPAAAPGIYVVRQATLEGPLTEAKAAEALARVPF